MGSLYASRQSYGPDTGWQPEPLQIPLDVPPPQRGGERGREPSEEDEEGDPSDLPGSHVVVIDVS